MRLIHVALADDWSAAEQLGEYVIAYRGTSIDDAGFAHAVAADALDAYLATYYADTNADLVLVLLDRDELAAQDIAVDWSVAAGVDVARVHGYISIDPDTVAAVLPAGTGTHPRRPDLAGYDVQPTRD